MLDRHRVLLQLQRFGVFVTRDHVVYKEDDHGTDYINKDRLLPHTRETSALCLELAELFYEQQPDLVIGPVVGGAILAHETARHLCQFLGQDVLAIYAEKAGDDFVINREYDALVPGKRVLIIEDILRTGASARKVAATVRQLGGTVIGLGALFNRGRVTADQAGAMPRLECLFDITLESWPADQCPLCRDHVPINTKVGHGKAFLQTKS